MFNDLKFCKDCVFFKSENRVHFCKHENALVQNHKVVDLVTGEVQESKMLAQKMRDNRCGHDGVLFELNPNQSRFFKVYKDAD